ncbi:YlzJ-like protein [Bacillus sp. OV322]|uniref:YlzJ-like family protein n=1 Tax=Bacillus sp. OV322 TaxID=1882764 RepID=UPI0008F1AD80|nr:YlzJ-like family protein [Bacillus sp. OV322]SFC08399.1 YlzJ-like protein [Bacillus sp. OV322]
MTLYTILPPEQVFPHAAEAFHNIHNYSYDGIPILIEQQSPTSFRVQRIISTDPAHYLVHAIQPGSYLPVLQGFNN